MKKICLLFRFVAAFAFAAPLAHADVSPTKLIGSGIVPRSESSIRMEQAKVEIVWGTPCLLTATFKMVNLSKEPEDIQVGFPMPDNNFAPLPAEFRSELSITFDGDAAAVTPPSASKENEDPREWVWFYSQHKFKPGTTTVVVKANLRASLVYATPFREALYYCIQTGGNWAGTIGEEEVTIRFPYPVEKDQITGASPVGYQIDGNCVRWRFVGFKPTGKEYDISLTYVRPDVMPTLATLRQEVAQHPDSPATAIKLAKHLLVLGNTKSNLRFPFAGLSKEEYDEILQNIATPKDRKAFVDQCRLTAEGRYEKIEAEWNSERIDRLYQVMSDAGYRDQDSKLPFILEGERLLKNILAREPRNSAAWNVYLANYWRFSFPAMRSWAGVTTLSQSHAKLIETAAKNCPNDECIRLWLKLRKSSPKKRDMTALYEAIKLHGFMDLEFPKIKYDYY